MPQTHTKPQDASEAKAAQLDSGGDGITVPPEPKAKPYGITQWVRIGDTNETGGTHSAMNISKLALQTKIANGTKRAAH